VCIYIYIHTVIPQLTHLIGSKDFRVSQKLCKSNSDTFFDTHVPFNFYLKLEIHNKKVLGRTFFRYGTDRIGTTLPTILCCRGNVFTQLITSNDNGTYRQTHRQKRPTILLPFRVSFAAGTYCHVYGVCVTIIRGSRLDDWVYWYSFTITIIITAHNQS
jgi:hypothetical protein